MEALPAFRRSPLLFARDLAAAWRKKPACAPGSCGPASLRGRKMRRFLVSDSSVRRDNLIEFFVLTDIELEYIKIRGYSVFKSSKFKPGLHFNYNCNYDVLTDWLWDWPGVKEYWRASAKISDRRDSRTNRPTFWRA